MGTRALILHEDGAIWKRYDGFPLVVGKEILEFCEGDFRNFNIRGLYNYYYDDYLKSVEEYESLKEHYTQLDSDEDVIDYSDYWVTGSVKFSELDMSIEEYVNETAKSQYGLLAEKGMLDAAYVYLIYDNALFIKGALTLDEESLLEGELVDRIYACFRQLFIEGDVLYYLDFNGEVYKVTL